MKKVLIVIGLALGFISCKKENEILVCIDNGRICYYENQNNKNSTYRIDYEKGFNVYTYNQLNIEQAYTILDALHGGTQRGCCDLNNGHKYITSCSFIDDDGEQVGIDFQIEH